MICRDSKLDAVAHGKIAFDLLVDADAGEAAGIVGGKFVVRFLDREQVCGWVDRDDGCGSETSVKRAHPMGIAGLRHHDQRGRSPAAASFIPGSGG